MNYWEKPGSIRTPRPFQNANCESMDELGKICPNLSFTVEVKKRWSLFELNIVDLDILFPKILRIYQ